MTTCGNKLANVKSLVQNSKRLEQNHRLKITIQQEIEKKTILDARSGKKQSNKKNYLTITKKPENVNHIPSEGTLRTRPLILMVNLKESLSSLIILRVHNILDGPFINFDLENNFLYFK